VWKRSAILAPTLLILSFLVPHVYAASVTVAPNVVINTIYGRLTTQNSQIYNSFTVYSNGTVYFDVRGLEHSQLVYSFSVISYGNGTMRLLFPGILPIGVQRASIASASYSGGVERVSYLAAVSGDPLQVVYGTLTGEEIRSTGFLIEFGLAMVSVGLFGGFTLIIWKGKLSDRDKVKFIMVALVVTIVMFVALQIALSVIGGLPV